MGPALKLGPCRSCKGERESYLGGCCMGKRSQCFRDEHPHICLHPTARAYVCSHAGRGPTHLLSPKTPCPALSPAPGLVPEPPSQMAEEGEVLGQEQRDG